MEDIKIAILNTKGGAGKSTNSLQVASTYFLQNDIEVELLELDDENKDSENFINTAIVSRQIRVEDGSFLNETLRNELLNSNNVVLDIGGNKTTTMFIQALKNSRMHRKINLFIIPISSGSQDLVNAKRTYQMLKELGDVKILFALSRVRNQKRYKYQYLNFFKEFKDEPYYILRDSDVIDLSRNLKKSVFEIAKDEETKQGLESGLDEAFNNNDNDLISQLSITLEIFDEAQSFVNEYIIPAHKKIEEMLNV